MSNKEQHVSPPAGDGTSTGLGEAFTINLNTGQGMFTQRIALPDGRAGLSPKLALEYASTRRHGAFGWGWSLNLRRISQRRGKYYDGGRELVPLGNGFYGMVIERAFDRYELRDDGSWVIHQRNGHKLTLGADETSRIAHPEHPTRIDEWLVSTLTDTSGNEVRYQYEKDHHLPYLQGIEYAIYRVDLDYEAREDTRTVGYPGYLASRTRRCSSVRVSAGVNGARQPIMSWSLRYDYAPTSHVSLLKGLRLTGHDGPPVNDLHQPETTFTYGSDELGVTSFMEIIVPDGHSAPPPLSDPTANLVTLESVPLPGILTNNNGKQYYWPNDGRGGWRAPRRISDTPLVDNFANEGAFLLDADGSGRPDLLTAGPNPLHGYYENSGREGWGEFRAYPRGNRNSPNWGGAVAFDDVNGDGVIDVLQDHGRSFAVWENGGDQGWGEPTLAPKEITGARSVDLADRNVRLADMTGDGKRDLVRLRSGSVEYWPNLAPGRFGDRVVMHDSPRIPGAARRPEHLFLLDLNQSGCVDLVVFEGTTISVYFNQNGSGYAAPRIIEGVFPPLNSTLRAVDFFGDGRPGLLYNSRSGKYIYQPLGAAINALMITGTDNGFGLTSTLTYRSAVAEWLRDYAVGKEWNTHFPFPLTVVAATHERDNVTGHEAWVSIRYHAAHFETRTRQFQGFARVERTDEGDESRPDRLTVHHFHAGEELLPGAGPMRAALNGQLYRKEIRRAESERLMETEEATYELTPLAPTATGEIRYFLAVLSTRTNRHDETDEVSTMTTTYAYDEFGNTTRETKTGSGTRAGQAVPQRTVETDLTYAVDTNRWIVDRIATKVQRNGSGVLLAEARNYYDGEDFIGLALHEVSRGLRTRQELFVLDGARFDAHYQGSDISALGYTILADANGDDAAFIQKERYAYDEHGLRTSSMNALGQRSDFTFDAAGLFRTEYTTVLGTTRYQVEPVRGRVSRVDNIDGTQLRLTYDALDRITDVYMPGNATALPSRSYSYDNASTPARRHTRYFLSDDPADFTSVHTYFDGRLKEVQRRVEQEPGTFIVSSFQRNNPFGDLSVEHEPFVANTPDFALPDPATSTARRFTYDVQGRPVRTVNFFGGVSTARYTPFTITTMTPVANDESANTPAGLKGLRKLEMIDPFNHRVRTVRELEGGEQLSLDYQLTELGQLISIDDEHGRLADYLYDRLGNRLIVDHREAGRRQVRYDAARKPVSGVDANCNVITSEYDPHTPRLLRLLHNGNLVEDYTYANIAGKLTQVTYTGGRQRMQYDDSGRLNRKEYFIDGQNVPDTINYEFDRIGRRTACVHTDGTRAEYQLYGNGWVKAIDGIADRINYDAFGNPVQIQYANGIVTNRTYGPGGRKISSQSTRHGATILENISYEYNLAGNLTLSVDEGGRTRKETGYTYDALEQLHAVDTDGTVDQYSYSGLALETLHGTDLRYDDNARAHRLTEIVDGSDNTALDYDANGNLLNLPGREFTYNFKNELVQCRRDDGLEADYFHDHLGMRVRKDVRNGASNITTRFVEDQAEYRNGIATYFFSIGRVRLGLITDGRKRYVHSNYLGNSGFFSDDTGTRIEAIAYTPFGNPSSSTGSTRLAAFGTHPYDEESGLYYMRKRYYAPEIGRFLTPDLIAVYLPMKAVGAPVAMHTYAYAGNNPTNNIDLNGTSFWSVVGGIVGAIVGVALAVFLSPLAAIIIGLGIVTAAYFIADANVGNDFGEFMRGFMIGFNAGMNMVYASILFGPLIGTAVGVINFLAVEESLTSNPLFEGILGWTSWLMPMSWLVTGVGLIFFMVNLIVAGVTFQQVDAVAITSINVDWRRGMINMEGGAIRAAGNGAAFNMGNFSFYDTGSLGIAEHEIGHGLNLGAFGWAFHYVGALDQAADPDFGGAGGVYAEDLAEGSMATPRFSRPGLDMWES